VSSLEPLREEEDMEEGDVDDDDDNNNDDDDGSASSQSDHAVVVDAMSSSPSLLQHKVSFCDDDDEEGEDDEERYDEECPPNGASVEAPAQQPSISALLQDLWTHIGSNDHPPTPRSAADEGPWADSDRRDADGESNVLADSDRETPRQAAGLLTTTDAGEMFQPKGSDDAVVVVQMPEAVIRRTKDNDESFDEVSL
jgi:hypothetical protein